MEGTGRLKMPSIVAFLMALFLSAGGVGALRRYAIRTALLDVPNERSSHLAATPRGGGLALVVATWLAVLLEQARGTLMWRTIGLAFGATVLVAWIGWRDDRQGTSVRTRLAVHTAAAALVSPQIVSALALPSWTIVPVVACSMFWTVSAINVINFMDGIDGLIGGTMVVYALHAWRFASDASAQHFAAALAGASAGFVLWNWNPARIFMGDVGSGALGVMLTVAAALAVTGKSPWSLAMILLPLAPLFLDATVTLLRRWRRGERLSQAHRSHLYQRLANGRLGHAWTSTVYIVAAAVATIAARFNMLGVLFYALGLALGGVVLERSIRSA